MRTVAKAETTTHELLKRLLGGASNSTIKQYFASGRVVLNGTPVRSGKDPVKPDDVMELLREKAQPSVAAHFRIVWEDDAIIVVDKEAGVLSSGEGITRKPTLHKLVDTHVRTQSKGKQQAYVVHRLDKEVTGLILFAKSEKVQQGLKDNWRSFTKKYLALTERKPSPLQGTIDTWLVEHGQMMHVCTPQTKDAVQAISHYRHISDHGAYSLVEVTLETGKKNQIRVHLAHIGCPIVGDRKHGADAKVERDVRLMAAYLQIVHPTTGEAMQWELRPSGKFMRP